jgi:hypothetical protein
MLRQSHVCRATISHNDFRQSGSSSLPTDCGVELDAEFGLPRHRSESGKISAKSTTGSAL